MLQNGISIEDLMSHFEVVQSAVYHGISGKRINLHFKILSYLKSCKAKRKAA
jgi:hypothetical protein